MSKFYNFILQPFLRSTLAGACHEQVEARDSGVDLRITRQGNQATSQGK